MAESKDSNDLDEKVLSSMNAPALREYIRSLLSKRGKPNDKAQADEADKEREALASMHAETHGKPPEIPATKEDMPFDFGDEDEEDDEDSQASEDASEPDAKPAKKKRGE